MCIPSYRHNNICIRSYTHSNISVYQTTQHHNISVYQATDTITYLYTKLQTQQHICIPSYRHNNISVYQATDTITYLYTKLQMLRHIDSCHGWPNSLSHTSLRSRCSNTVNISNVVMLGFCLCLFMQAACLGGCVWYCVGVVFVIVWGLCLLLCGVVFVIIINILCLVVWI